MPTQQFEMYLTPKQKARVRTSGREILNDLEKKQFLGRCLGIRDDIVKGWLAKPSTYPKKLRGKSVLLWRWPKPASYRWRVDCLVWRNGRLFVHWFRVLDPCNYNYPTVLVPKS